MADFYHVHPELGEIQGLKANGIIQFLGIQYATLKDRLSEPVLRTDYPENIDARHYGPASPSPPGAFKLETEVLIQHSLPNPPPELSDVDCLNLNITLPERKNILAGKQLPVFVWIHGGGFVVGANSWPQYDPARLIRQCASKDMPVIGISINFRLGLPGLLTSEELRNAGYKENNFIRDQRAAFFWVQKFISGFGGDSNLVTVIGESTGAVAGLSHLYSETPLFNRAIATGGSPLLVKPALPPYHEFVYEQVVQSLGLKEKTAEERLNALLTIPLTEIMKLIPPHVAYMPMKGEFLPITPSFQAFGDVGDVSIPGKKWCQALMMGDCQFDSSSMAIFMPHLKINAGNKFSKSMKASLAEFQKATDDLLKAYGFNDLPLDDDVAFDQILDFLNDLGYYVPSMALARGWPGKAYLFHFNEKNPWEGQFKGRASHVLDVAFLFQNFNDSLPRAQKAAAERMGLDLMTFVSGKAPWKQFSLATPFTKVYGSSSWDEKVSEPSSKIVDTMDEQQRDRRGSMLLFAQTIDRIDTSIFHSKLLPHILPFSTSPSPNFMSSASFVIDTSTLMYYSRGAGGVIRSGIGGDKCRLGGQIRCLHSILTRKERKVYVQDRISEEAELVGKLLIECGAWVYICGDGGRTTKDVKAKLDEVVNEQAKGKCKIQGLKDQGGFHEDIW